MGDIASWQRANNKKTSPLEQAPAQHNAKIYGTPPGASMNPKIAKPTHQGGVCGGMAKGFADGGHATKSVTSKTDGWAAHGTRVFAKMADGGDAEEAAMKQAGLEASKDESVGLLDRLRMGNIDDPSSEAYRRFGAGRGRSEAKARDDADFDEVERSFSTATSVTGKEEAKSPMTAADFQRTDKDATPVAMPARPARVAPRVETKTAPASKPAPARVNGKTFSEDVAERKKNLSVERASSYDENYGNEGRRSVMAPRTGGKRVIDTSNIDSKTLLPKR